MYCPRCGQERASTDTSFCSKCGFLLSGTLELLMTGGVNPSIPAVSRRKWDSPRSRGVKKGLFIFLLTFLIVPIISIVTVAMHAEPYLVVIASILLAVGGLLRMAYAWMFESPAADETATAYPAADRVFKERSAVASLMSETEMPAASYIAPAEGRKTTNELQPASVTEGTTRLLQNEEFDQ